MNTQTFIFEVNGQQQSITLPPDTPLLYVLRNDLKLKGTRFGCGLGQCGSCTVLLNGRSIQSCNTPVWAVAGKRVTTIEGLGSPESLHPLQQAILDEQAAQCGYCLSGILMSAKALLDENPNPSEGDIREKLDRNLCRCGTHGRIVRAIQRASKAISAAGNK
jgi:nicotinate dehydrogenase subunit A